MNKQFIALFIILSLTLTGCSLKPETQYVEIPTIIKEIEFIEVPVIVKETEVVYVPRYVDEITISVYFTSNETAVICVGRGSISYIMEIAYENKIFKTPKMYPVQLVKQVSGKTEDYFYFKEFDGYKEDEFMVEVDDIDEYKQIVSSILDNDIEEIYLTFEDLYNELYKKYYGD